MYLLRQQLCSWFLLVDMLCSNNSAGLWLWIRQRHSFLASHLSDICLLLDPELHLQQQKRKVEVDCFGMHNRFYMVQGWGPIGYSDAQVHSSRQWGLALVVKVEALVNKELQVWFSCLWLEKKNGGLLFGTCVLLLLTVLFLHFDK